MTTIKRLILSLLLTSLCLAGTGWGATYYVDATLGKDTYNGTTTTINDGAGQGPWKTLDKVSDTSYVAGDTVLFKSGETFRPDAGETVHYLKVGRNGTSESPITFSSYGTGAAPIIKGSVIVSGEWTAIGDGVYSISFTPISAVRAVWEDGTKPMASVANESSLSEGGTYYYKSATTTLYVRCYDGADPSTHVIEATDWNYVIYQSGDYTIVENLDIRHGGHADAGGVYLSAGALNAITRNNTIQYSLGGIQIINGGNPSVYGNTIRYIWNRKPYMASGAGTGIAVDGLASVYGNFLYKCYEGILISHANAAGGIIHHNIVSNTLVNSIDHGSVACATPVTIMNNTVLHSPLTPGNPFMPGVVPYGNATINHPGHGICAQSSADGYIWKNNLIVVSTDSTTGTEAIRIKNREPVSANTDYNLFYIVPGSSVNAVIGSFGEQAHAVGTVAAWVKVANYLKITTTDASGIFVRDRVVTANNGATAKVSTWDTSPVLFVYDQVGDWESAASLTETGSGTTANISAVAASTITGKDAHSLNSDPLFTTGAYTLTAQSPAINAGVNICTGVNTPLSGCTGAGTGTYTDYAGKAIKGLPDIGAYEFYMSGGGGAFGRLFQRFKEVFNPIN